MTLARFLAILLLVAAGALAACGNKGPLILAPTPGGELPPPDPVDTAAETAEADAEQRAADAAVTPTEAATVTPPPASTVTLPPESTPDSATDGTSGTPR
jgi:predicted small lipoprotein YifL